MRGSATSSDLKRLLNGRAVLIENFEDTRRLVQSDRLHLLIKSRSITRGSSAAVDPSSGAPGSGYALRSADRDDCPLLVSWDN